MLKICGSEEKVGWACGSFRHGQLFDCQSEKRAEGLVNFIVQKKMKEQFMIGVLFVVPLSWNMLSRNTLEEWKIFKHCLHYQNPHPLKVYEG